MPCRHGQGRGRVPPWGGLGIESRFSISRCLQPKMKQVRKMFDDTTRRFTNTNHFRQADQKSAITCTEGEKGVDTRLLVAAWRIGCAGDLSRRRVGCGIKRARLS